MSSDRLAYTFHEPPDIATKFALSLYMSVKRMPKVSCMLILAEVASYIKWTEFAIQKEPPNESWMDLIYVLCCVTNIRVFSNHSLTHVQRDYLFSGPTHIGRRSDNHLSNSTWYISQFCSSERFWDTAENRYIDSLRWKNTRYPWRSNDSVESWRKDIGCLVRDMSNVCCLLSLLDPSFIADCAFVWSAA